jgi:hypothetical protein
MRQWLRSHLTYANVVATLSLFLVLGGGTALAAYVVSSNSQVGPGTISGHKPPTGAHTNIIGGSVNATDLANQSVTQAKLKPPEPWHELGATGEPTLNSAGGALCSWSNFDSNHDSAAFYRDPFGVVHLKGVLKVTMAIGDNGDCWYDNGVNDQAYQIANRRIFTLPLGYRPAKRLTDIALTNGKVGRIDVDGPGLSGQPAGAVSVDYPTSQNDVKSYLSLNGISFRCSPSGQNGCP